MNVPIHRSRSVEDKVMASSFLESFSWEEEEEWVTKLKERRKIKRCKRKDPEETELVFLVDL